MIRVLVVLGAVAVLSGCGPMPVAQAEQQCEERARLATGPRGTVGIGIGSGGPVGSLDVTVSSDFLRGSDPVAVYDRCVRNLSGQGPTRLPDLG
jgi:hypothetical protein